MQIAITTATSDAPFGPYHDLLGVLTVVALILLLVARELLAISSPRFAGLVRDLQVPIVALLCAFGIIVFARLVPFL